MSEEKSFNERLKKMKKSVRENADVLDSEFPADVTNTGSEDLVKNRMEIKDTDEAKKIIQKALKSERKVPQPANVKASIKGPQ